MRFAVAIMWIGVAFIAAVLVMVLITMAWPRAARAHDAPSGWQYGKECCADKDCHPTPCERIAAVQGGFEYRDYAGATYFFTREKMKISLDDNCHVCISLAHSPTCVYLPARTERRLWTRPSF